MESHIKIKDLVIDLSQCFGKKDVSECEHFTIRGYTSEMRKKDPGRYNPFPANEFGELPPLPPLEVRNFKRFGCDNCHHKVVAEGNDETFVRECDSRQQEHVANDIERRELSVPMSNSGERGLDLNQVVDFNGSESVPSSDERENNNEVMSVIPAQSQSKKELRRFPRVSRKITNVAKEDYSSDEDGKPKKTRLLSEVMRTETTALGGMLTKRKGVRGRKRKSLMEENHHLVEAQHHISTENELDRVVEDSFSPSCHQYKNSLPFSGPFQVGISGSQHNTREENEPRLFQDLNLPPIDINENMEPKNLVMNVDLTEESRNRPVLIIDNEEMEVAEIMANNLQPESPPQQNSLHEQRKRRDFDLNCPIVDEELDSNIIVCPPINVSDGNLTMGVGMIGAGETSDPMRIFPVNYFCRQNRNPADFTAPEEGNPYMTNGEDLLIFERYNPRKSHIGLAIATSEFRKKN